jgi:hypothetical protein
MESKIQLFDANNIKVGETFSRRARQLVNQQRAEWTDESQTAIRFAPDAEMEWETPPPVEASFDKNNGIYLLAETRLRERYYFILHSIAFLPVLFFIIIYGNSVRAMGFAYFFTGGWMTAYAIHLYLYIKKRLFYSSAWQKRRIRKLESEVERIKMMGRVK